MFDNIGGKIKFLAKVTCILEALAGVIYGFIILVGDTNFLGLLIMFFSPLVAWVASWLLYGFGQLIENSDIIAERYQHKDGEFTGEKKKTPEVKINQKIANTICIVAVILLFVFSVLAASFS